MVRNMLHVAVPTKAADFAQIALPLTVKVIAVLILFSLASFQASPGDISIVSYIGCTSALNMEALNSRRDTFIFGIKDKGSMALRTSQYHTLVGSTYIPLMAPFPI